MEYAIIVGGGLQNKGAQSMTFVTVNEIKKRFPHLKIILFSGSDYMHNNSEYTFEICKPIDLRTTFYLQGGFYRWIANLQKNKIRDIERIEEIYRNTKLMIDISGYVLGSNWPYWRSISYMLRIKTAKHFGINTFLMPQSFGPFNYTGIKKILVHHLIKTYLKFPKVIYAREKEGYDLLLKKYRLRNIVLSEDMVLLNKKLDIRNIYNTLPEQKKVGLLQNAVAIIPNAKNFVFGNKDRVIDAYREIVEKLLSCGKSIYILRHAKEDIDACNTIKEMFAHNDNVILISDEFTCIEYDLLVKGFDYLIASRFHSIVHAYKNGIPCIALGWATKYHELLHSFHQDNFIFDVRKEIDLHAISEAIDVMNTSFPEQSKTIQRILAEIQRNNIFDVVEESK